MFLIWLFSGSGSKSGSGRRGRVISGDPPVVMVTVFDEKLWGGHPEYLSDIRDNRMQYAEKHGKSRVHKYLWSFKYTRADSHGVS